MWRLGTRTQHHHWQFCFGLLPEKSELGTSTGIHSWSGERPPERFFMFFFHWKIYNIYHLQVARLCCVCWLDVKGQSEGGGDEEEAKEKHLGGFLKRYFQVVHSWLLSHWQRLSELCLYIRGRGEGLVFPRQPGDSGRPPSLDFESANSAAFPTNWPQAEMEKWNNRRVWSPAKLRFQINCFVAELWDIYRVSYWTNQLHMQRWEMHEKLPSWKFEPKKCLVAGASVVFRRHF